MTTTVIAPTNIAILKYWGKLSGAYHIPTKSSLSFTVNDLFTKTSVEASKGTGRIDFSLNGKKEKKEHDYVRSYISTVASTFPALREYDYRIASENNFPTAAGFASSASGFAALLKALAREVKELRGLEPDDKKLSALARLGSGSAARSIPSQGGFVKWDRGSGEDWEKDPVFASYALTLFGPEHWPDLRIIYAIVEEKEKKVSSRAGMEASMNTNPLYQAWVSYEESLLKNDMVLAVGEKNFSKLAPMIMQASNNFHAVCLGTYPPIHYLEKKSLGVMDGIHRMNKDGVKAAYTFDAGPNPVIFTLKENEDEIAGMLEEKAGKIYRTRTGPGPRYVKDHLF